MRKLIESIRKLVSPPGHVEIAARELQDALRSRLGWMRVQEEAKANVATLNERIKRLQAYIQEEQV